MRSIFISKKIGLILDANGWSEFGKGKGKGKGKLEDQVTMYPQHYSSDLCIFIFN